MMPEKDVMEIFNTVDTDGNGFIDVDPICPVG